jgi:hypothetical protein
LSEGRDYFLDIVGNLLYVRGSMTGRHRLRFAV